MGIVENMEKPSKTICKTVCQYNKDPVNAGDMKKLLEIAEDCRKVKNYVFERYGGIRGLSKLYPGYTIQNEMTASGLRVELAMPSVYFYLAVFDALGRIKSQWTSTKAKLLIDYRMEWEDDFLSYLKKLEENKPVIVCGDMNVAHKEIDLKNPKTNRKNAGFTDEERSKFTSLLDAGFIDTFRHFYPDLEHVYSWWSYRFKAREKNAGWRIDYFLVSDSLKGTLKDAVIYKDIMGSDHCPVGLIIED